MKQTLSYMLKNKKQKFELISIENHANKHKNIAFWFFVYCLDKRHDEINTPCHIETGCQKRDVHIKIMLTCCFSFRSDGSGLTRVPHIAIIKIDP